MLPCGRTDGSANDQFLVQRISRRKHSPSDGDVICSMQLGISGENQVSKVLETAYQNGGLFWSMLT